MNRLLFYGLVCVTLTACNSAKKDREEVVSELDKYKLTHAIYPLTLEEAGLQSKTRFYYKPDSTQQSYILSYTYGAMDANTARYDSNTKQWTEQFAY